jgi:hypothetical protein
MQIRNQWKGSKNWKLVTGVATAATLGFGAIAVAAPDSNDVPHSINLNDRAVVSEQSSVPSIGGFVPFDISADDTDASLSPSPDASVSPDTSVSGRDDPDASPSPDDSPSVDESVSAQDSLDASPQASIDDSTSVQDDSFDSVSNDSFDDSDDSD